VLVGVPLQCPILAIFGLELPRIDSLLFIFADSLGYQIGFPLPIDTFATRLIRGASFDLLPRLQPHRGGVYQDQKPALRKAAARTKEALVEAIVRHCWRLAPKMLAASSSTLAIGE
jgi:hypothetical protein